MKAGQNKKTVRVEFVMSEQDAELVKGRMAELGITNLSAYLRKMAVDGYIIHLDMGDIQEMVRLLRICSNNLNQYAKRANETGSVYAADVEDLRTRLDGLWDGIPRIFSKERYSVQTAAGAFTGSGRNAKKARMFTIFIALPTAGYSKKAVKA